MTMAEHASDYTRGEMEIQEHTRTYAGFVKMAKWGSLYIAALILFITVWFCTPGGFSGGLISALVLIGVATLTLSEKHEL
jgi:hypothetical protein